MNATLEPTETKTTPRPVKTAPANVKSQPRVERLPGPYKPQPKASGNGKPPPADALDDRGPVDEVALLADAKLREFDAFYEEYRGKYFIRQSGLYVGYKDTALRRRLKLVGFSDRRFVGGATEIEAKLVEIERQRAVRYAMPLAGYRVGVHDVCGQPFLVTSGPHMIEPRKGDCRLTRAFHAGLYGPEQLPYLLGWEKLSFDTLRTNGPRPGQALAICGTSGCGKSLWQGWFTEFIGGRACKPFDYLMGETRFNEELCGAEHWMIEDDAHSYDPRKRAQFGTRVKNAVANDTTAFHPKGRTPIQLRLFKRVTITLNDEPESLFVLPIFNDSVAEKIMLLRAHEFAWPMPMDTDEQKSIFRKALSQELPAWLWYLQKEFVLPVECRERQGRERYGVKTWHHPELLEVLHSLSPESKLLSLIDRAGLFGADGDDFWLHKASELDKTLRGKFPREANDLLRNDGTCAQLLAALSKRCPERITKADTYTARQWKILPPKD